jgi:AraC-like DNA-binding protein
VSTLPPEHPDRFGPRSAGGCHQRRARFERLNNLLRLHIAYVTFGTQRAPGLHSRNFIPHHRLFIIPESSTPPGGRVGFTTEHGPQHLCLTPGTLTFLPGPRSYTFTFKPGLQLAAIHYDLELFAGCDAFGTTAQPNRQDLEPSLSQEIWELGNQLDDLGGITRLRGHCLSCSGRFLHEDVDLLLQRRTAAERFAPILAALDRDLVAGLGAADLAPLVDLAPSTLARQFSAATGIPLKTFIGRRLAQRACEALIASDRTIRSIADEFGFSSEFYFSRFFKKQVGMAPSAYRALGDTSDHQQAPR